MSPKSPNPVEKMFKKLVVLAAADGAIAARSGSR
jgi:hypothetical protein